MLGLVVVVAVPDAVQLGLGLGTVPFDTKTRPGRSQCIDGEIPKLFPGANE